MFKNQRHAEIVEILKSENFAGVRDLSERLFASQPTIRRDLDILEKQGYIRRSHGGAVFADGKLNTPVPFRKGTHTKEKIHICELAATLLKPDSLIFTDASTTVLYLADLMGENDNITVVTNGLQMCHALVESKIKVFSTGGRLLKDSEAFVGRRAEDAAGEFNANLMFFSAASMDSDGIISDFSEEENTLRRVMKQRSEKCVFLIDSAKIGTRSPYRLCSLTEIDYVVTDLPLPDALVETYQLAVWKKNENALLYQHKP